MKLSVSLPEDEVAFIDTYAGERGIPSRSAVIQRAVELLRMSELGASYAQAWADWDAGGDAEAWEPTAGDGLAESA